MKFENTKVYNFEGALHGMRNPLASWSKSDSHYGENGEYIIGEKDLDLARRLILSGTEHRKFMRQIFVSVDITAPIYWWKEFDTYKVGTAANSTSTMHKLASTPITLDCFDTDDFSEEYLPVADAFISECEKLRQKYAETKDKRVWKELVRWLPEGWLQTRTVTMNYENITSMIRQRKDHKLNEWSGRDDPSKPNFIAWTKTLPYSSELLYADKKGE